MIARYIDVECDMVTEVIGRRAFRNRSDIQDFLDSIPTVDVVSVVRCKDCKHCEYINDEFAKDHYQCKRQGNFAQKKPNDYCSYGEKC